MTILLEGFYSTLLRLLKVALMGNLDDQPDKPSLVNVLVANEMLEVVESLSKSKSPSLIQKYAAKSLNEVPYLVDSGPA